MGCELVMLYSSDDGDLYTWGKAGPYLGYSIQSGKSKQMSPRKVESLSGKRIVQVACGRWHTLGVWIDNPMCVCYS